MVKERKNVKGPVFDAQAFLDSAGVARKVVEYRRSQKIYSQGDPATTVMYVQKGGVKLSVVNEIGNEQSWQFWDQVTFLVRGHGRSVCSNGDGDRDYTHEFTRY